MLSKSSACVKYLLFFFNLIFVVTGIVLIAVGSTVLSYYREYDVFLEYRYISAAQLIIVVGVIVLIVAFFGCCGAAKEHYCMTMTFAGLLIFICILELAGGIAGYVLRNEAADSLRESMIKDLEEAKSDHTKMEEWDKLQVELKCCGAINSTDWGMELPVSCCGVYPANTTPSVCTSENAFHSGCIEMFSAYVQDHALSIGGVGIGIAFIQFVGIVLSCSLARAIRSEYETV
ncbi:CD63 antigen [Ischnura elegans]|uniref:CD63 antigen n=1 Tax=Ischnura elegans TaxID=197161 RepID=UPI001ED8823F|nr:CD63 antigen [Ischnura elegans]